MHAHFINFKKERTFRIRTTFFLQMFRITDFFGGDCSWVDKQEDVLEERGTDIELPMVVEFNDQAKRIEFGDWQTIHPDMYMIRSYARPLYIDGMFRLETRYEAQKKFYDEWIYQVYFGMNLCTDYLRAPSVPSWLTDADVANIAEGIRINRDWKNMPILADALMDAGCDDETLINYCKGRVRCTNCLEYKGRIRRQDEIVGWIKCFPCRGTGFRQVARPGFARSCGLLNTIKRRYRQLHKGRTK